MTPTHAARFSLIVLALVAGRAAAKEAPAKPRWKKIVINAESMFEAATVADFNGDRKLDVWSGDSWYQAPRWTRHKVRDVPPSSDGHYFLDLGDLALDVNGDGRMDVVTCSYHNGILDWLEQPADPRQPWTAHQIDRPGNMETCRLVDVNGDGKPDVYPSLFDSFVWYELAAQRPEVRWEKHVVGKQGAGHGNGYADVDSDGRIDLIGPKGWWAQPKDPVRDPWMYHGDLDLGAAGILILGRDVDGDGMTDIVWGMGHNYGVKWLRQKKGEDGGRAWERLDIDKTLSQAHSLQWVALDRGGEPALVTGKRVYSHEVEPGATDAPGIYAYRYDRRANTWNKEVIYEGTAPRNAPADAKARNAQKDFPPGSAGTGTHMEARDMDGDGDIDLVCPGKSGLYLFQNLAR